MGKFDLEERLVEFSVSILEIVNSIPKTVNGLALAKQLSRSGTSVVLHYGEAQAAESKKDFIHKMKIVLKELRETSISLKIINKSNLLFTHKKLEQSQKENLELIFIFIKSIETAKSNLKKHPRS